MQMDSVRHFCLLTLFTLGNKSTVSINYNVVLCKLLNTEARDEVCVHTHR